MVYRLICPLLSFFTAFTVCSQQTIFKDNLSNQNPAATGMFDRQFHMSQVQFIGSGLSGVFYLRNQYDKDLVGNNSGVGVNLNYSHNTPSQTILGEARYRYASRLTSEVYLSLGLSAGVQGFFLNEAVTTLYPEQIKTFTHFGRAGVSINTRYLSAGLSASAFEHRFQLSDVNYHTSISSFIWYDHVIAEGFSVSPYWVATFRDNIKNHHVGVRTQHKNSLWWIAGVNINKYTFMDNPNTRYSSNTGIGYTFFDHLKLGYNFGVIAINEEPYNRFFSHQISLSYTWSTSKPIIPAM